MRLAVPDGPALQPFFAALRGSILTAWDSRFGFDYDRVIYAVSYPYQEEDIARVLAWCGRSDERARLPPLDEMNRTLVSHDYPALADLAGADVSPEAWSAVLHFCDPSYPLYTEPAAEALRALGFTTTGPDGRASYSAYLGAVDLIKAWAPMTSIPETNWYLARNIGVGLEDWSKAHGGKGRSDVPAIAARGPA